MVLELMPMPIKERVRELRIARGMTQQALAVAAGLSISAVVHIEAGRIPDPRLSTVKALAQALGVPVDELARNGGEAKPAQKRSRGRPRKEK